MYMACTTPIGGKDERYLPALAFGGIQGWGAFWRLTTFFVRCKSGFRKVALAQTGSVPDILVGSMG